jgi:DNA-binding MarR family transcriptional regulator
MARRVLDHLRRHPEETVGALTNSKLADQMQVSPFSVSRALSELERNGYVEITWSSPNPRQGQPSGRRIRVVPPHERR